MNQNSEREINLSALQQRDPYITSISDSASQVAIYSFKSENNEWEKTNVEGTLFVYNRSAFPLNGFMVINRLHLRDLIEPIDKHLEFQLQDPFLLYRNVKGYIIGIWFYDKDECARIGQLLNSLVQVSTMQSQQNDLGRQRRASESDTALERADAAAAKPDGNIMQMLSKAQNEYEKVKCQTSKKTQAPANNFGKIANKKSEATTPGHTHINLESLFKRAGLHHDDEKQKDKTQLQTNRHGITQQVSVNESSLNNPLTKKVNKPSTNHNDAFQMLSTNHNGAFQMLPANHNGAFQMLPTNHNGAFQMLPANQNGAFQMFPSNECVYADGRIKNKEALVNQDGIFSLQQRELNNSAPYSSTSNQKSTSNLQTATEAQPLHPTLSSKFVTCVAVTQPTSKQPTIGPLTSSPITSHRSNNLASFDSVPLLNDSRKNAIGTQSMSGGLTFDLDPEMDRAFEERRSGFTASGHGSVVEKLKKDTWLKGPDRYSSTVNDTLVNSNVLLAPMVFQTISSASISKTTNASPNLSQDLPTSSNPALITPLNKQQLQIALINLLKTDSNFLSLLHEAYIGCLNNELKERL